MPPLLNIFFEKKICSFVASGFGLGHFPVAPATVGSLPGILIFLLTKNWPGWLQIALWFGFCLVAIGLADKAEREAKVKDPQFIIIDEIAGMWTTLLLIWRDDWAVIIFAFLLFRALDILKVFPLNVLEGLRGGVGIVADDLASGMLANFALRLLIISGLFG